MLGLLLQRSADDVEAWLTGVEQRSEQLVDDVELLGCLFRQHWLCEPWQIILVVAFVTGWIIILKVVAYWFCNPKGKE